jgi:CheY-like chemotaxis protein
MVPVLVIDDSRSDLQLAQRELLRAGILNPVYLLPGAEDCLAYFSGRGDFPVPRLPCLALVDLVMPPVSGLDLLRRLRMIPKAAGSVMVMLSGVAAYKNIAEGYALGATTFIVKPITSGEIIRTLSAVPKLAVVKRIAGLEITIPTPAAGSLPVETTSPLPPGVGG